MAKKWVFKKTTGLVFFWVLLVFFGFYWVLLISALPITWFYWVLLVFLGFFSFLNKFWAVFDFCPFELFFILVLFLTGFLVFYGIFFGFSLFLNDFGGIFNKTQKNPLLVGFLTGFYWVFWAVFFWLGFFGHP